MGEKQNGVHVGLGLPLIVVLLLNLVSLPAGVFQGIVVVTLAWMGVACLINSKRCRRVHCAFTGPWFLLGSGTLLLDLLGGLSLNDDQATCTDCGEAVGTPSEIEKGTVTTCPTCGGHEAEHKSKGYSL